MLLTWAALLCSACSPRTHILDESCIWFDEQGGTTGLVLPDRGEVSELTVEWWLIWMKEGNVHHHDQTVLTNSLCVGSDKPQEVEGMDCESTANYLRLHLSSKEPNFRLSLEKNDPQNATFPLPTWKRENIAPQHTRWTHYALSYSATRAKAELFVNGELQSHSNSFDRAVPVDLGPALVGDWIATDQGLRGCVRELRFWKKQLNKDQVQNAMNCQANKSKDLIAAYPFKHDIEDVSGNGFHATGIPKFASPLDLWHTTQVLEPPSTPPSPSPGGMDCVIGHWNDWTACSKSCGGGFQVKEPHIMTYPRQGGKQCPSMRMRVCSTANCGALESQLAAYASILNGKERDVKIIMYCSALSLAVAVVVIVLYRKKAVALAKEIDTTHELQFEMANASGGMPKSPLHEPDDLAGESGSGDDM
jgi:hypothetical protein